MTDREKKFISAVVYVHNSESNIAFFIKNLLETLTSNFDNYEVICVNDLSHDNSAGIIKSIVSDMGNANVTILNMSFFHGVELAMSAGVDLSIGDYVFEFDSTAFDFEPSCIMDAYYHALEGYDIVSMSPDIRERMSSHLFYRLFRHFSDGSYVMVSERFRILSRRVINRVYSDNKTIAYRKALYASSGLRSDNLKYKVNSKIGFKKDDQEKKYKTGLAVDTLILFTDFGYSFAKSMTAIMMFMSISMVLYSVIIYALSHPVEGWTTTILFLSLSFFGLFGILTVIIKYLQLLVNLTYKRKHYSYESIEKITG